jgi:hypothetical protein
MALQAAAADRPMRGGFAEPGHPRMTVSGGTPVLSQPRAGWHIVGRLFPLLHYSKTPLLRPCGGRQLDRDRRAHRAKAVPTTPLLQLARRSPWRDDLSRRIRRHVGGEGGSLARLVLRSPPLGERSRKAARRSRVLHYSGRVAVGTQRLPTASGGVPNSSATGG